MKKAPFPPDYLFSKENRPTTDKYREMRIKQTHSKIDFRSAVCTPLLYLAYNTWADILFAVTKLAKACIDPGEKEHAPLYWLLGYIKAKPDLTVKFYPKQKDSPRIHEICDS